ncbi:hypothetical protein [Sneathiella sp.]|uniref:hypothetical protein n=1 Tax=Sneathiella sp. TaxID=1964365 RepID=UPI002611F20E|nr:hypothetical protein [Sneathiella sp.]MDF2367809.1 hypothetical protein [Sneathiella sp.]
MKARRFSLALGLVLLSTQFVQASFEKGQEALDRDDASTAIEEWQPVAQRGDARAQYALGQIFEKGSDGVEADIVEAYAWFKLAAAQDFEEASEATERLRGLMSTDDLRAAQTRSLATLGLWYRDFTGQDEAAFQEAKATMAVPEQQSAAVTEDTLAEQRAAAQRELIAQRKADAEAKAKALEESRQAAIQAAQAAAEEAKSQAELREQKIEEQRRAIAQKDNQQSQTSLAAAKARLADLMAKQQGGAASASTTGGTAVAAASPTAAPVAAAKIEPKAAETMQEVSAMTDKSAVKAVAPEAKDASAPAPSTTKEMAVTPKVSAEPQKVALATTSDAVKSPVAEKVTEPPLTESKTETLTALKSLNGLNKDAVEEIFEQAKIADLDNAEAQTEIEVSLVRIEALKWSLISGAKGDHAAPKMNKVLMSKMSPVQIAEANRLAGEWLIERQKQL